MNYYLLPNQSSKLLHNINSTHIVTNQCFVFSNTQFAFNYI